MGQALTKYRRLAQLSRLLLLNHKNGSRVNDLARELGITYSSVRRYLDELGAISVGQGRFNLIPTQEDIELAHKILGTAEGFRFHGKIQNISPTQTQPMLTKQQRLRQTKRLLLLNSKEGLAASNIASALGIAYNSIWRYLIELGAISLGRGRYRLIPTQEDIDLAHIVLETAESIRSNKVEKFPSKGATKARQTGRSYLKQQRLERGRLLLLRHRDNGLTIDELASELGIAFSSAWRYLNDLGAIPNERDKYRLIPTQEDILLAQAVLKTTDNIEYPVQFQEHAKSATDDALTKQQRLGRVKRLLLLNQDKMLTAGEIAAELDIAPRSVWRYLDELGAIADGQGRYRLIPTQEDIELAHAVLETAVEEIVNPRQMD